MSLIAATVLASNHPKRTTPRDVLDAVALRAEGYPKTEEITIHPSFTAPEWDDLGEWLKKEASIKLCRSYGTLANEMHFWFQERRDSMGTLPMKWPEPAQTEPEQGCNTPQAGSDTLESEAGQEIESVTPLDDATMKAFGLYVADYGSGELQNDLQDLGLGEACRKHRDEIPFHILDRLGIERPKDTTERPAHIMCRACGETHPNTREASDAHAQLEGDRALADLVVTRYNILKSTRKVADVLGKEGYNVYPMKVSRILKRQGVIV